MLFTSPIFLFAFFPFTLILYFILPKIFQNYFLLLTSIIFYWWGEPKFIGMILLMLIINYFGGLLISTTSKVTLLSKLLLFLFIFFNLIFLFTYKYRQFFYQNISYLIKDFKIDMGTILLPLAISFFTFHAISYLIDVYKKTIKAESNVIQFALYFLFFPHLIAGPIVRYSEIFSDLKNRSVDIHSFSQGICRFIIGLSKKVLIADALAFPIDEIFATPPDHLMPTSALVGMIGYTLQIFFDFSGYSDMAIGLAQMFGFKFPENFHYPYASTSVTEFWRRWHMSLSRWFRDYIYIPLGGNRRSPFKTFMNLWIVFLLVGLWHGAGWNFIIWGIYQGIFLSIERLKIFSQIVRIIRVPKIVKHFYLIFAVMIGWVFFRSQNGEYAVLFIKQIFQIFNSSAYQDVYHSTNYFLKPDILLIGILGIIFSFPNHFAKNIPLRKPLLLVSYYCLLIVLFILAITAASVQTYNPFIYFRF